MNCYNGRLPVEALAHRSWPPIQKKHNTHILTEKKCKSSLSMLPESNKWFVKKQENVQKWHVYAEIRDDRDVDDMSCVVFQKIVCCRLQQQDSVTSRVTWSSTCSGRGLMRLQHARRLSWEWGWVWEG